MAVQTNIATPPSRPSILPVALGVAALAALGLTAVGQFGAFSGEADYTSDNVLGWLISVAAIVVAAVVTWQVARGPLREEAPMPASNRALVLGILSVISFPAFWLGVYALFAAGALVLGRVAFSPRGNSASRLRGGIGMVLASLGAVFCAFLNITG